MAHRIPCDESAGIVAGACGNPAVLAYGSELAPTDGPDLGYAMIFPGMAIVKILFVDIVPALFTCVRPVSVQATPCRDSTRVEHVTGKRSCAATGDRARALAASRRCTHFSGGNRFRESACYK